MESHRSHRRWRWWGLWLRLGTVLRLKLKLLLEDEHLKVLLLLLKGPGKAVIVHCLLLGCDLGEDIGKLRWGGLGHLTARAGHVCHWWRGGAQSGGCLIAVSRPPPGLCLWVECGGVFRGTTFMLLCWNRWLRGFSR